MKMSWLVWLLLRSENMLSIAAMSFSPSVGFAARKAPSGIFPSKLAAAFTLVEMLVVLAVIALLAMIAVPATSKAINSARAAKSAQNLRTLSNGVLQGLADHNGLLPTANNNALLWNVVAYEKVVGVKAPTPFFDPHPTGANLKGTAFYCPFLVSSGEGTPKRSYGWNIYIKDGVDTPGGALAPPLRIARVKKPSASMMMATTVRTSAANPMTLSSRANGKVLVTYLDGHGAALAPEEIPTSAADPFWRPY
jgi:prepilin-type N-terminal cleavage/methylation domain-containing protein